MATFTYTVTVASGTNAFGTGNKFYINGEVSPVLYLQEGNTYVFDNSDSTNSGHPFNFSSDVVNSYKKRLKSLTTNVCPVGALRYVCGR